LARAFCDGDSEMWRELLGAGFFQGLVDRKTGNVTPLEPDDPGSRA
jgi:hypothetical protein